MSNVTLSTPKGKEKMDTRNKAINEMINKVQVGDQPPPKPPPDPNDDTACFIKSALGDNSGYMKRAAGLLSRLGKYMWNNLTATEAPDGGPLLGAMPGLGKQAISQGWKLAPRGLNRIGSIRNAINPKAFNQVQTVDNNMRGLLRALGRKSMKGRQVTDTLGNPLKFK